jgi:Membrane-associated lipoprotein involved in thiamine biosynthesis
MSESERGKPEMGTFEKMFTALGTVNTISVRFEENERESVRRALDRAEAYISGMDDRLSVFKPDSLISRVNANAGVRPTLVDRDTFDLLRLCVEYGRRTCGVFDVTTKPLTDSWDTGAPVDYRDILLDEKRLSVMLRHPGQGIHLGGVAKGYAVDRAADILQSGGVTDAVINLGGTVRNIGRSGKVGIRNPFEPEKIAACVESVGEAVVTSGLYERGNHIYDPISCKPALGDLASVTVLGSDGAAADAAATACMVLGFRKSPGLLSSFGLGGIFILRDGGVFVTEEIRNRIMTI